MNVATEITGADVAAGFVGFSLSRSLPLVNGGNVDQAQYLVARSVYDGSRGYYLWTVWPASISGVDGKVRPISDTPVTEGHEGSVLALASLGYRPSYMTADQALDTVYSELLTQQFQTAKVKKAFDDEKTARELAEMRAIQHAQEYAKFAKIVADRILAEADDAGLCDQYDAAIRRINEQLDNEGLQYRLTARPTEYEVQLTYSVTIQCHVLASSEDEAEKLGIKLAPRSVDFSVYTGDDSFLERSWEIYSSDLDRDSVQVYEY